MVFVFGFGVFFSIGGTGSPTARQALFFHRTLSYSVSSKCTKISFWADCFDYSSDIYISYKNFKPFFTIITFLFIQERA